MDEDKKPFNDAIDHMNKIEGNVSNLANADLKKLPRPLKYIGYFMIGFLSISILLILIVNILK
ncbi:amino acid transporter [Bacillus sp. Bva_UNVM-123]|uniref:amino acid transporter n=1 Tax=Bacillus sp. Bva_UNVM-123 TaxID=2829798 RepID=UPI00391F217E